MCPWPKCRPAAGRDELSPRNSPMRPSERVPCESMWRKSRETLPAWPHGNQCRPVRAGRWRDRPAAGALRAVAWLTVRAWTPFHTRVNTQQAESLRTCPVLHGDDVSVELKGDKVQTCRCEALCRVSCCQKNVVVAGSTWGLGVVPRVGMAGVPGAHSRPLP